MTAAFLLAVSGSFAFKAKGLTGTSAFFIFPNSSYCNLSVTEQDVCDFELTGPVCTVKLGDYHRTAYYYGPGVIPCTVALHQL